MASEIGDKEIRLEVFISLMKALGNRTRLYMLYLLSREPMSIYELSKRLGLSYPLTFLHLKQLKKAGLIKEVAEMEKHGPLPTKLYSATEFSLKIDKELIRGLFREVE